MHSYCLILLTGRSDLYCIDAHAENTISVDDVVLFILLYADDAVIFAKSAESLQNMINDIQNYCNTWR